MADFQYPKDETLRLVLSADQDQWLQSKINESRVFIWAMLILLGASVSWVSGVVWVFEKPQECFTLVGNGSDHQVLRENFLAQGLVECVSEVSGQEAMGADFDLSDKTGLFTLLAIIGILVSSLVLVRHIFQLKKFKGYQKDHQAFLAKYNRLKTS